MKKFILQTLAATLLTGAAQAQVKLGLTLLPDGQTYEVSMTPEATWASPQNTTGSAQIVVAAPVSDGFLVKDLKSQVTGLTWLDDTYVENPPSALGWTFVSFTIKELGTKAIPFEAGLKTPLFTFRSASGDCTEGLLLLDNTDALVHKVVADKFNVTQSLTVLGMRGNAVSGITEGAVDCPEKPIEVQPERWVSRLTGSPIPAATWVDLNWVNAEGLQTLELQLFNEQGQLIKQHILGTNPGAQSFHIELEGKVRGIYSVTLVANGQQQETLRLAVMP